MQNMVYFQLKSEEDSEKSNSEAIEKEKRASSELSECEYPRSETFT